MLITLGTLGVKKCVLIVLIVQVGGTEEYKICDAIKNGVVTKPIIVWCIGTCAGMFTSEVSTLGSRICIIAFFNAFLYPRVL